MNTDLLVAKAMLVMPVLLSLLLLTALLVTLWRGLATWKREGSPPGWMMQTVICICVLQWIVLAGMDVGQFLVLFSENWGGLVAVAGVFFVPWIGMQTVKGIKTAKGGSIDQVGGGAP